MTRRDLNAGVGVPEPKFEGHLNYARHRTVGRRAWCDCGDWCYQSEPCYCCKENLADLFPCPLCDGTGINASARARAQAAERQSRSGVSESTVQ